jgi:hypothetical protein
MIETSIFYAALQSGGKDHKAILCLENRRYAHGIVWMVTYLDQNRQVFRS